MREGIEIVERIPAVAEFQRLEAAVGFRGHDEKAVAIALENSVFVICAFDGEKLVGVGRIVGDALRRIGKIQAEDPPVEPAPAPLGYRNKATMILRRLPGGRIVAGRVAVRVVA